MTLTSFVQKHPFVSAALGLATAAATAISPKIAECFSPTPDCGLFTCSTPETICTTVLPHIQTAGLATALATGAFSIGKQLFRSCAIPTQIMPQVAVGASLTAINQLLGNKATCSAALGTIVGSLTSMIAVHPNKTAIAMAALAEAAITQATIPLQPVPHTIPILAVAMFALSKAIQLRTPFDKNISFVKRLVPAVTNSVVTGIACATSGFSPVGTAVMSGANFALNALSSLE